MSREEEVQKLIDEETGIDNYGSSDYQVGVCDGVRLADKTMIDKACNWLKDRISIPYEGNYNEDGEPIASDYINFAMERLKKAEEICNDFRKAMEE